MPHMITAAGPATGPGIAFDRSEIEDLIKARLPGYDLSFDHTGNALRVSIELYGPMVYVRLYRGKLHVEIGGKYADQKTIRASKKSFNDGQQEAVADYCVALLKQIRESEIDGYLKLHRRNAKGLKVEKVHQPGAFSANISDPRSNRVMQVSDDGDGGWEITLLEGGRVAYENAVSWERSLKWVREGGVFNRPRPKGPKGPRRSRSKSKSKARRR